MGAAAVLGGIAVGSQVVGGALQGYAAKKQAEIDSKVALQNADVADYQAADSEVRGGVEVGRVRRAGAEAVSAQRVALGASGVDMQSGSALDMLADTRALNEVDAQTARANAARESWGFRAQATQYRGAAARAKLQGKAAGATTILGGLGNLAGLGSVIGGGK